MSAAPFAAQQGPGASPDPVLPPVIEQPRPAALDFPPWNDPLIAKLGYTLSQAIEELGSPKEIYSLRDAADPALDTIVFYYDDNSYLFWWRNRVWQIRFDKRYRDSMLGLTMGQSRAQVEQFLGKSLYADADELIYQLPERGFPVRLRLMFEQNKLSDFYLYRADF